MLLFYRRLYSVCSDSVNFYAVMLFFGDGMQHMLLSDTVLYDSFDIC